MPRKLTPRKLPSQDRARATVEALLQAATEVLQAEGLEGLTTNKIAERAGVSIGTLYQYFPNKESLLVDLVQAHLVLIRDTVRADLEAHQALPLQEMVPHVMQSVVEVYRADLKLTVNLEKLCLQLGEKTYLEVVLEEIRVWTQKVLEQRNQDRELSVRNAELTSFVVVRAVEGVLVGAVKSRPDLFQSEGLVPQLCTLVLGYLAPELVQAAARTPKLVSAG